MALYVVGKLKSEPPTQASGEGIEPIPSKVLKNCKKYLPLEPDEELLLLVDETLLGSGKEGIAVTTERLLSYDKSKLKLKLRFDDLKKVEDAKLDYADAYGLVITRSGGRALRLQISHVGAAEVEIVAGEIRARLAEPSEAPSKWQCPTCGPGEVIYLPKVRYSGPSKDARIALLARDLHICRDCGSASLQIEDPSVIQIEAIPGAELRLSGRQPD